MEKAKKTKKSAVATTKVDVSKKSPKKEIKSTPAKNKALVSVKTKNVKTVQPAVEENVVKTVPMVEPAKEEKQPKKTTLNQELNLLIGLFSLITIISFCFEFQGGDTQILGWELILKSGEYSGVFKGLMILYVVSIFIDCILTIRIDTDNEIINIVEKALYMFTAIINFVVVAVLLSIITKIGIGLIIFFILSIISAIVKFSRIFAQK
ncbi:MAG: hypothetical protein IJ458_02320 [Clostridia bacterium]|nr:hypothetical protein [Clostridia bacterium]